MRRVIFFAALALAVFSCTYGGNNNTSGTTDSADLNADGTNNAMGAETIIMNNNQTGGSGVNGNKNSNTTTTVEETTVGGSNNSSTGTQSNNLNNRGSAVNTSPERNSTRDSLK